MGDSLPNCVRLLRGKGVSNGQKGQERGREHLSERDKRFERARERECVTEREREFEQEGDRGKERERESLSKREMVGTREGEVHRVQRVGESEPKRKVKE
ncbi:hypothetical protein TorRG33x02_198670 [Trema orientale]|uniref:Uncharacterized protein n=1 Tax=Trema orientale TaxID=63057 RepID=A0A2P5EFK3_TREOI|nr:hypothetical protein TorRG33x02_198670 [Trema orientale]